jgi:hypothetical protein
VYVGVAIQSWAVAVVESRLNAKIETVFIVTPLLLLNEPVQMPIILDDIVIMPLIRKLFQIIFVIAGPRNNQSWLSGYLRGAFVFFGEIQLCVFCMIHCPSPYCV